MPDTATSETGTTTAGATGTSATWLDLELDDASALHRVGWQERPGLFLSVPATCQFALQARLAAVSQHMGLVNASSDACHRYLLNRHSIGRASASGVPFSELQSILITLLPHDSITSKQMAALHRWHEQGRSLRLTQLPLLRTQNKGQMAALWQEQPLRPLLGELLSPTVATLVAPLDEVSHLLRQAGYFVPPAAPEQTRCVEIDGNIDIAAERLLAPAEGAVLWLAGQIYRQLGEHLALPAPLPSATLAYFWQGLDPHQQALLQSQLNMLTDALVALLDGYALTPPVPNPLATDPEQWRQRIGRAIDQQQTLRMRYYSAGRNLLTERTIEPHWIEERYGYAYVRAYCHNAGRVLVFRLDRIQELRAGDG